MIDNKPKGEMDLTIAEAKLTAAQAQLKVAELMVTKAELKVAEATQQVTQRNLAEIPATTTMNSGRFIRNLPMPEKTSIWERLGNPHESAFFFYFLEPEDQIVYHSIKSSHFFRK